MLGWVWLSYPSVCFRLVLLMFYYTFVSGYAGAFIKTARSFSDEQLRRADFQVKASLRIWSVLPTTLCWPRPLSPLGCLIRKLFGEHYGLSHFSKQEVQLFLRIFCRMLNDSVTCFNDLPLFFNDFRSTILSRWGTPTIRMCFSRMSPKIKPWQTLACMWVAVKVWIWMRQSLLRCCCPRPCIHVSLASFLSEQWRFFCDSQKFLDVFFSQTHSEQVCFKAVSSKIDMAVVFLGHVDGVSRHVDLALWWLLHLWHHRLQRAVGLHELQSSFCYQDRDFVAKFQWALYWKSMFSCFSHHQFQIVQSKIRFKHVQTHLPKQSNKEFGWVICSFIFAKRTWNWVTLAGQACSFLLYLPPGPDLTQLVHGTNWSIWSQVLQWASTELFMFFGDIWFLQLKNGQKTANNTQKEQTSSKIRGFFCWSIATWNGWRSISSRGCTESRMSWPGAHTCGALVGVRSWLAKRKRRTETNYLGFEHIWTSLNCFFFFFVRHSLFFKYVFGTFCLFRNPWTVSASFWTILPWVSFFS